MRVILPLDRFPLSPGPVGLVREVARLPMTFGAMATGFEPAVRAAPRGDGHTVLVLPGLTAGDLTTWPLRRFLTDIGYRAAGWELGQNRGLRAAQEPLLQAHLARLAADGPVTIIGWSLGGAYARELDRLHPELVRRVVTLGTPIRSHEGAEWVIKLFTAVHPGGAGDLTPEAIARAAAPLEVPTTAIFDPADGILDGRSCRVRPQDVGPHADNIRVRAGHLGMGFDPAVWRVIAEVLRRDIAALTPSRSAVA